MAFRLAARQTERPEVGVIDRFIFPIGVMFWDEKCGRLSADYGRYQILKLIDNRKP
ncbi:MULTISPECIES: hypothetical protein [Sphingomonas]|jgi:hypothetical protein|uniref:hypothetical protein n=1 Tax=Sphingomonas TaxID=13687 RepID=UPI001619702D|nr:MULTISPECIES: hypothetical protein [Sphingomonas]MBB3589645.1 hypothetical protein [Sphingomonas sp. BK481]